jgi:hypothetical protein
MRKNNVALRLQTSLPEEARINVAVAEKLSALRTEDYFRERRDRANITLAKRILKRAGQCQPPVPGDELPA